MLIFYVYDCFACICLCSMLYAVSEKARGGGGILWNWGSRELLAVTLVLGTTAFNY